MEDKDRDNIIIISLILIGLLFVVSLPISIFLLAKYFKSNSGSESSTTPSMMSMKNVTPIASSSSPSFPPSMLQQPQPQPQQPSMDVITTSNPTSSPKMFVDSQGVQTIVHPDHVIDSITKPQPKSSSSSPSQSQQVPQIAPFLLKNNK